MLTEQQTQLLTTKLTDYLVKIYKDFSLENDADKSFSSLGLDSMSHVNLTLVIEEVLGVAVEPEFAFNYPTVNAVIKQLNVIVEGSDAVI